MKKRKTNSEVLRYEPDPYFGLTDGDVEIRRKSGLTNKTKSKTSKSYLQIILHNTFSFFSCLLFAIAIIFLICNSGVFEPYIPAGYFSISKFSFLLILLINIIIGIVQEIRSKVVLEKLKLISKSKYKVIRNKISKEVITDDIVIDDIILLSAGDQIPVDCKIISGKIEVDESVLTGESDTIEKQKNDKVYSGSFVISGAATCYVEKVGHDTYAMTIQSKVKNIAKNKSELMKNIYGIIKVMSVIIVIMIGLIIGVLYYKMTTWDNMTWADIVASVATVVVGLIPTGLVLLTSVTLAVSIISLVKKKVLIQELYSLEGLSRVNTICLDKTGTLTIGEMKVAKVIHINKNIKYEDYLGTLINAMPDKNATMLALMKRFKLNNKFKVKEIRSFTSATKSSEIILEDGTDVVLGAPEFILDCGYRYELDAVKKYAEQGLRILALTVNNDLAAFICLEDVIRPAAIETIKYFNENGVNVKIISGDNPVTVSNIAKRCGVLNSDKAINMQNVALDDIPDIVDQFTVFGRITPEQKEAVVKALQAKGKKVAMTGDGVNDLLALKAANTSISFNSATDAAKGLSDVVLLDNSFDKVPDVVKEGRRVVSNITRTSILFLTKTFLILLVALFTIPTKTGITVLSLENLTVFEVCLIALAGFLLSIENSKNPITTSFKATVYPKAIASGLMCSIAALVGIMSYNLGWLGTVGLETTLQVEQSLMTLLITISGIVVLLLLCYPFTPYRLFVLVLAGGSSVLAVIAYPNLFLNVDSSGFTLTELFNNIIRPFDFGSSIYPYFTKEAFIVIIVFSISIIPIYIFIITFINWLLKRSFMKKLIKYNEDMINKFGKTIENITNINNKGK